MWGKETPTINLRCRLTPGAHLEAGAEAELRALTEHGNGDAADLEAEALFSQPQAPKGGPVEAECCTCSPALPAKGCFGE